MEARRRVDEPRSQFWLMSMRCCLMAGSVDVAFFFIFHYLGSPILAWINVLSVGMYVIAYWALKHRHNRLAVLLIWVEVIVHAALGTLLIGWDSGFYYYLLMFIPALYAGNHSLRSASIAVFALWLFYVGLNTTMRFVEPIQPIAESALLGVYLFNLTCVFIMFSYLSLYYITTVKKAHRILGHMATTDPLTHLFNRRHMIELAERDITDDAGQTVNVAFLLMDIDYFKQFNDRYGHDFGDRVLCEISQILSATLREQDYVGRWGGEEFLAVLPHTDTQQAQLIAERVRAAVAEHDWMQHGLTTPVTMSIGVSHHRRGEVLSDSIVRADAALYAGKDSGRNRVEVATGGA
ncbi:GGDEF domain-containing protein [Halopseudomonas salegens]|uniref:diguanylate cyclase n=1 Tax=Halopseudomonas salegens TaxID=1434072 RepID=A0A1H2HCB4_9GAMM|nr:diguanylate cyclase [Halopseudomonas salegens]SDU29432.1 diguanylate cyclase (GGDEF) domain-containing protein [Halopseudomonas salegens]